MQITHLSTLAHAADLPVSDDGSGYMDIDGFLRRCRFFLLLHTINN